MSDNNNGKPPAEAPDAESSSFLNRREFLGGAGAAFAFAGNAFAAERPYFDARNGVLSFKGKTWTVAKGRFERGVGPIQVTYRDEGASQTLSLKNALYPGTDLPADFDATLNELEGVWYVRLSFASVKPLIEPPLVLPLEGWVTPRSDAGAKGYTGSFKFRKIDLGRGGVIHDTREASLTLWSDFSGMLWAPQNKAMRYAAGGSRRRIAARLSSIDFKISSLPAPEKGQSRVVTRFSSGQIAPEGDVLRLGSIEATMPVSLSCFSPSIVIRSFHERRTRDADVVISAQEASLNIHGGGAGPNGTRIQLDDVGVSFRGASLSERLHLRGQIARRDGGRGFEAKTFSAAIEGDPSQVVDIVFGARPLPSLSIKTNLLSAHVPVDGNASADIAFAPAPSCEILIKPSTSFPPPKTHCRSCDAFIWVGERDAGIQLPLEPARLRLRRSEDLFDLSFGFLHHALRSDHSGTLIEQRWAFADGCNSLGTQDRNAPRVIVHFAPQHVFEQAFLPPTSSVPPPPSPIGGRDACYNPMARAPISSRDLAQTRISGPTRLVFEEKCDLRPVARRLTVDYLTDWADLAMVVNKRALPHDATLEDQLKNVGITQTSSRLDARARVMGQARPPADDETSIEAIYRVLLSPDCKAKWTTPKGIPAAGATREVWAARLKDADKIAMRAIYARQMDIGFLTGKIAPPSLQNETGFVGSLNQDDRRQIVALTSFYGLAALRRIIVSKDGKTAGDDPNGMVFLPNRKYAYLDDTDYKRSSTRTGQEPDTNDELSSLPQEGVVLAKAFDRFHLTLSRSATVDALWQGEPPAGLTLAKPEDPFFFPAFTVERYLHRIRDGRDAFVEVTYKGFLYPLGHRAALLKVTRREFHPYKNADQTRPIAYLVQHLYIVCRKPLKTYRAFNQPFNSYDFPPSSVELKTIQTPDLADPKLPTGFGPPKKEPPVGDSCRPVPANGKDTILTGVFWPTLLDPDQKPGVENPGGEVMFEYAIDGQDQNARSPLLFVDNAAAHDPTTMGWVTEYYNNTIPEARLLPGSSETKDDKSYLRIVDHGGMPRRYAAEQKDGQCTFDTASWVLAGRGLIRADKDLGEVQDFHMDAFMEGRDQPPFYPMVKRAAVNIQPVNRLIGRKENLIAVSFNPRYVRGGFDPERNPAEIYLDILEPRIYLDASRDGQSTGAVAKPNIQLAALSRKIGPVGGQLPDVPAKTVLSLAAGAGDTPPTQPVGVTEPATSPVSSALAGQFNPLEYFIGAAGEARLLGIIPLKDILKAVVVGLAPKLVERAQYLSNEVSEQLDDQINSLRAALSSGLDLLEKNLSAGQKSIRDNLIEIGGANADPVALYPALWNALTSTVLVVGEAKKGLGSNDLAALSNTAGTVVAQVNRLLAEVRAVARDPMPANVRDAISKIKEYSDKIQAITKNREAINEFVANFAEAAFHQICEAAVETEVFESIFGPLHLESGPYDLTQFPEPRPQNKASKEEMQQACRQLLQDPAGTLPRLQEALFYEAFSGPLVSAIDQFRSFKSQVSGAISQGLQYSRRALADRIAVILRQNTERAELDELTIAAYTIAGAIVQALNSLTDSDLTPENIQAAIAAKVATVNATIANQVVIVKEAAKARAEKLERDVEAKLKEAQTALKEQKPDLFYALTSEADAFHARERALRSLHRKLEGINSPEKLQNAVRKEIESAVQTVLQPAIDDAKAAIIENAKAQAAGWTRRIMQLADTLLTQALNTASAVAMAEASKNVKGWCGSISGTTDQLVLVLKGLLVSPIKPIDDSRKILHAFDRKLKSLLVAVANLGIRAEVEPKRQQLSQLLSAVAVNNQSLIALIDEFERVRDQLNTKTEIWTDICGPQLNKSISVVAHAINVRCRIAEMLAVAIGNISDALTSAAGLSSQAKALGGTSGIQAEVNDLLSQIVDLTGAVTSFSYLSAPNAAIDAAAKDFIVGAKTLGTSLDDLRAFARDTKTKLDTAKAAIDNAVTDTEKKIKEATELGRSIVAFSRRDREFVAIVVESCFAGSALQTKLNAAVRAGLGKTVDFLIKVNGFVLEVVQTLVKDFSDRAPGSPKQPVMMALASIVPAGAIKDLGRLGDALGADQKELKAIQLELNSSTTIVKTVELAGTLRNRWRDNPPAVLATIQFVEQIIDAVASGHIQNLIDVSALERELKNSIVDLIPARISLSYDFDAELPNYPSGGPIFLIDRDSSYYDPGSGNDLVISTNVQLNVLTGDRSVNASGRIRPFKIHLLGSGLDLITLKFKGANFSADPAGGTHFSADIAGFEIGAALKFLSALAGLSSGGNKTSKKDGFYYEYSVLPPEVEVGYRFNKPLLVLGSLTFQNIGFAVSAHLPFDYRHAEFRASFATREKPFLVSQPTPIPLGGGGFVGLRASARGIVAFEISLEFGVVAAISIGPLEASGRITVGMYLLSYRDGGRRFEGFMHAVGEGHIACFGLSFLIEVRTVQTENSSMEGSATYSFSFEVMSFEVSYSLIAESKTQGGGSGSNAMSLEAPAIAASVRNNANPRKRTVRTSVSPKMSDWRKYAKHFQI